MFDPVLEASVFVHDFAGNLVTSFDLRSFGFTRVFSVSYLPASDELVLIASDLSGTIRVLLTDRDGNPHRSFRTDSLFGIADVAAITSGPFAGDIAAVMNQPSTFLRLALP